MTQENKQSKIKRVYEDDTWVIDVIDGKVRVSYFENNHFVDDVILSDSYFYDRKYSDE